MKATYSCFYRHMMLLKEQYGKQVIVNLLRSKGGEEVLGRAFKVKTKIKAFLLILSWFRVLFI